MTRSLLDSSAWIALAITGHPQHQPALAWFDALDEPASAVFCRSTQQTFLRLLTQAALFAPFNRLPLSNREAWERYSSLLADDRVAFRGDEPPELERLWSAFALPPTASPNLWMDAYLAAFALAGDYQLVTFDRAFRQFEGLDVLVLGDAA